MSDVWLVIVKSGHLLWEGILKKVLCCALQCREQLSLQLILVLVSRLGKLLSTLCLVLNILFNRKRLLSSERWNCTELHINVFISFWRVWIHCLQRTSDPNKLGALECSLGNLWMLKSQCPWIVCTWPNALGGNWFSSGFAKKGLRLCWTLSWKCPKCPLITNRANWIGLY